MPPDCLPRTRRRDQIPTMRWQGFGAQGPREWSREYSGAIARCESLLPRNFSNFGAPHLPPWKPQTYRNLQNRNKFTGGRCLSERHSVFGWGLLQVVHHQRGHADLLSLHLQPELRQHRLRNDTVGFHRRTVTAGLLDLLGDVGIDVQRVVEKARQPGLVDDGFAKLPR